MKARVIFNVKDTGLRGHNFLTHRWQKHFLVTSQGAFIAAVHHTENNALCGCTHMYRKTATDRSFVCVQTLSASDIGLDSGDMNAGIMTEDHLGNIYATGHSNPAPWNMWYNRLPFARTKPFRIVVQLLGALFKTTPQSVRTNVIWVSKDDGKSWEVLRNDTAADRKDPPHPHNLYWDGAQKKLWWLVGHDGARLLQYDPETKGWKDLYAGSSIEKENRLPLCMHRTKNFLWLGCEVSGPDHKHLYKSSDSGATWKKIDHDFVFPAGENNDAIWAIDSLIHPDGHEIIYVAGGRPHCGNAFVKASHDEGHTWETIYIGEPRCDAWLTIANGKIFLTDRADRILCSENFGKTFTTFYASESKKQETSGIFAKIRLLGHQNRIFIIEPDAIFELE